MDTTTNAKNVDGPKSLFWYLSLFFTLGITAFSLGGIWFQMINKLFPLEIAAGQVIRSFNQDLLKGQIAAILIAAPVFFLFSWLIRRSINNGSLNPGNKIRTWITYIILFIVVAIGIGDLIAVVLSILNGEFTARFILKALSILVIVSWIFAYYFSEIRAEDALKSSILPKIFGGITAVIIVVSFVGSFFLVDSPAVARVKAFDQTRVSDLEQIRSGIISYYSNKQTLPDDLDQLSDYYGPVQPKDPANGSPYEYRKIDNDSYELCATFETSNVEEMEDNRMYYPLEKGYQPFIHEAGRKCFELTVPESVTAPIR